jgi:hypothetical protein
MLNCLQCHNEQWKSWASLRPEHDFPTSEKCQDGLVVLHLKNAATRGVILHCFKSFHNTEASERVGILLYIFRRLMSMPAWVRIQLVRFVLFHQYGDSARTIPVASCPCVVTSHHSSRPVMSGKVFSRLMLIFQYIYWKISLICSSVWGQTSNMG